MEKMDQHVQQGDAEFRIETMSADEINQVSGGNGPNRYMGGSFSNPHAAQLKPNVKTPSSAGVRTIFLS